MAVRILIDRLLVEQGMSVRNFAAVVGITPSNVAVLENGRARAIRLSTLGSIGRVLHCQPGDILVWHDDKPQTPDFQEVFRRGFLREAVHNRVRASAAVWHPAGVVGMLTNGGI